MTSEHVQVSDFLTPERPKTPFNEKLFRPDKIVEANPRTQTLVDLIYQFLSEQPTQAIPGQLSQDEAARHLFDMVAYSAGSADLYGTADTAADFCAAIDTMENPELENCVVLIQTKTGAIGPPGGFPIFGESPYEMAAREIKEEIHEDKVQNWVATGISSLPTRDDRKHVLSLQFAGIVSKEKLIAGDDASRFVVVKLGDKNGNLNPNLFNSSTIHDELTGKDVPISGFRFDHDNILMKYHSWWLKYGLIDNGDGIKRLLSLQDTIKRYSGVFPKEYFDPDAFHPDKRDEEPETLFVNNGEQIVPLKKTANIDDGINYASDVFRKAGYFDPDGMAQRFILHLTQAEIFNLYRKNDVTGDVVLLDGDKIWVIEKEDDSFALPGAHYAVETNEKYGADKRIASSFTITDHVHSFMRNGLGINVSIHDYLGPVGGWRVLGRSADTRHERYSHTFICTRNGGTKLVDGMEAKNNYGKVVGKLRSIDIYGKSRHVFSDTLRLDNDGYKFQYGHREEIIPLLLNKLKLLRELSGDDDMSAEQLVRTKLGLFSE